MRVRYDTVRVCGEGVHALINVGNHEMVSRSGMNAVSLQYGKWKRKQGLVDGEVEWDEPTVFAQFLKAAGLDECMDLPITRFDSCRDLALGSFSPSEFIHCVSAGFSSLGGRWSELRQKDTYLTLQKNKTAFTIYWKRARAPEVSEKRIRFEYRLMDSASIKRDFGKQLRLRDLCSSEFYENADTNYRKQWDGITDNIKLWTTKKLFAEPTDDLQAGILPGEVLRHTGVKWDGTINAYEIKLFREYFEKEIGRHGFLAVLLFIGIHCCRRAFGREWWKLFPTPDEKSKKQLQRVKVKAKQIHKFYEWGVKNGKFESEFKVVVKGMLGLGESKQQISNRGDVPAGTPVLA